MNLEFLRDKGDKLHQHDAHWAAEQVWLAWAEEAQAHGRAWEAAQALERLSRLTLYLGDYSRAIAYSRRGVAAVEHAAASGPDLVKANLILAQTLMCAGHLPAAAGLLQDIRRELAGSRGDPLVAACVSLLEGIRAVAQGDFAGWEEPMAQALAVFEEYGEEYCSSWAHWVLGSLWAAQGRRLEARSRFTTLLQRLETQQEPVLALVVWADLALLAAEERDWDACRSHLIQGTTLLRENPVFIDYRLVGRFMAAYAALAAATGRVREGARNALMAQLWLSRGSTSEHLVRRAHQLVKGPSGVADPAVWDYSLMDRMFRIESLLLHMRPHPQTTALPGVVRLARQVISLAPKLADEMQSLAAMQHNALVRRLSAGDGPGRRHWFRREAVDFWSNIPITDHDSVVVEVLDDYDRAIEAGEPYDRVLARMHAAAGDPHRLAVIRRLASCQAID